MIAIVICWNLLCWQFLYAQPVEPVIVQTIVKINDQTVEIATTTTTETIVQYDRAELQTELDHIADRKTEIQKRYDEQLSAANKREVELIEILKVFE